MRTWGGDGAAGQDCNGQHADKGRAVWGQIRQVTAGHELTSGRGGPGAVGHRGLNPAAEQPGVAERDRAEDERNDHAHLVRGLRPADFRGRGTSTMPIPALKANPATA